MSIKHHFLNTVVGLQMTPLTSRHLWCTWNRSYTAHAISKCLTKNIRNLVSVQHRQYLR